MTEDKYKPKHHDTITRNHHTPSSPVLFCYTSTISAIYCQPQEVTLLILDKQLKRRKEIDAYPLPNRTDQVWSALQGKTALQHAWEHRLCSRRRQLEYSKLPICVFFYYYSRQAKLNASQAVRIPQQSCVYHAF